MRHSETYEAPGQPSRQQADHDRELDELEGIWPASTGASGEDPWNTESEENKND